ncbi:MAG: endopeptidase La [Porphyromonas sp.]|nr:endopeptidase La [Porphyromonas sp.]
MIDNHIDLFNGDEDDSCPVVFPVLSVCDANEDFEIDAAELPEDLPILAMRNMTLFPGIAVPILVGREKSMKLIRYMEKHDGFFGAIAQKDPDIEHPDFADLYSIGVIARLVKLIEMPDGSTTGIIQGHQRFRLEGITSKDPFLRGQVQLLSEGLPERGKGKDKEFDALVSTIQDMSLKMLHVANVDVPKEILVTLRKNKNPLYQINFASASISAPTSVKQELLEIDNIRDRGYRLLYLLHKELQMLELKATIQMKTREEMDKQQKEYFLQQQIKTIQEELGGNINDIEVAELRKEARKTKWSEEIAETFERELRKLERIMPQSPDYSVQLQYLQTLIGLPWGKKSKDNFDLRRAERVLNRDHFGLEKVKERILEHLAVLKLKGDMKSPIICLYGPPGVGKTSLGKSIAESLNRQYVRVSLGGVHDEAEIRGHRRTYIGAMPGRIIKSMQKAGTMNPVFVLDEIDKLNSDFKGDPASALLEVLDPEQNTAFHDNYLDVDFDLSQVLFIATANSLSEISRPLLDRMELIEVNGYILEEKVEIAAKHLIPKQLDNHGFEKNQVRISKKAIERIVEDYTRESGVRGLDKQIATLLRKMAKQMVYGDALPSRVGPEELKEYLGSSRFSRDKYQGNELPGVVTGLAWTQVGGEILFIEASLHKGKEPKLILTGNLGDVMKESAILAMDYIRAHALEIGVNETIFDEYQLHVHVPEGAVPKDGPSAGITMVTAIASALTKRKVRSHLAMTGEITLRGKVLPVGGIREKILAAKRSGITDIVLCSENKKDIMEINEKYLQGLSFHYVDNIDEVLSFALID